MCFPDVDECALGTDKCSVNALCSNSEGSYSCTCKLGYSGDGTDCDGKQILRLNCVVPKSTERKQKKKLLLQDVKDVLKKQANFRMQISFCLNLTFNLIWLFFFALSCFFQKCPAKTFTRRPRELHCYCYLGQHLFYIENERTIKIVIIIH